MLIKMQYDTVARKVRLICPEIHDYFNYFFLYYAYLLVFCHLPINPSFTISLLCIFICSKGIKLSYSVVSFLII